ncbi:MAG: hypothetical protein ACRYF4_01830 [Janthinobacterium lividum]
MSTAVPTAPPQRLVTPALLFVLSCGWIVVSLAGGRLAGTLSSPAWYDLSREAVTAAMLFVGFYAMARLGVPDLRPLSSVGMVRRPGIGTEFGRGAALGWGFSVAMVLPALLGGNLRLLFSWDLATVGHALVSMAMLLCFALVVQLILAGLPVRLLVRSVGANWTVTAVVLIAVLLALNSAAGQGISLLFTGLSVALFVFAFLWTRAIWLPLGLQLGWTWSLQVLFGARSPYTPATNGPVQNDVFGPVWLTGGSFGPEASTLAILLMVIALIVLFRLTRDYAWHYTYQPITAAGYPMDVPPPAEHLRQEGQATAAAPLIQIGGIAPAEPQNRIL